MSALLTITVHELRVALRTKRALVVAAAYLGCATLAGVFYVLSLRELEQQAIDLLIERGADPLLAAGGLSAAAQPAFEQAIAFFADTDVGSLHPTLTHTVVLPFLLWGSLAFLPFLIVLTSFDQMAQVLHSRSVCYSTLRASRTVLLLGKAAAQVILFATLLVASALAMLGTASGLLETFHLTDALWGAARLLLLLMPFGLCYVGLSTLASSLVRQPFVALLIALALMVGLRTLNLFRLVDADGPIAALRHLRWLSPAAYHTGLWRAGWTDAAQSSVAYLGFTVAFLLIAALQLETRDL